MIVPQKRYASLLCLAILGNVSFVIPSYAATLTSEGHAAGAQCTASDVNDSGVVVGSCVPGNGTGPTVAFVATSGTETALPPLVSGQSCSAAGVSNGGVISGACRNASNDALAVTWSASSPGAAPTVLNPFPAGLLGLLTGDVSSAATGYNQSGAVIGASCNINGDCTGAIWNPGSGAAVAVSNLDDNCAAVDVNASLINGEPSIVLDCPNPSVKGTVIAEIAQATSLLGGYVLSTLPIPSGYSFCSVGGINDSVQMVGTCHTTAPDQPDTVFWSSPTSTPTLLSISGNPRNGGAFINSEGHVVFGYQTTTGVSGVGFWNASTNSVSLISPLPGGTRVGAVGLADNDTVALNSEDSTENVEAATWTSSTGTVAAGFEGGGQASVLASLSKSGNYAVGGAQNSAQTADAVATSLP
jgi:hypothetical protein